MIDWETFKSQLQTNPGKVLKSVLLLAGCLLLVWLLVVVQTGPVVQDRVKVQSSGRMDSMPLSAGQARDSLQVSRSPKRVQSLPAKDTQSDVSSLLPTVLIFLIAIGGLWFWVRSGRSSGTQSIEGKVFTTVASQQLPGGQQLLIIKLNEEYWVMATGGTQGMTLLHRYTSAEWQGINQPPEKNNWKNTFLETLHSSTNKQKKVG